MSDQPSIPPAEAPVPPVPAVVLVPTTASATDRDVASDLAGQPRSEAPPLTPPGTEAPTFWQSAATHAAIVATVFFGFVFVDGAIDGVPPSADVIKLGYRGCAILWMAAFGIYKTDTSVLRWK